MIDIVNCVHQYLARENLRPSRFGRMVCGDPRLVFDLRNGRRMGPHLLNKVAAFLKEASPQ